MQYVQSVYCGPHTHKMEALHQADSSLSKTLTKRLQFSKSSTVLSNGSDALAPSGSLTVQHKILPLPRLREWMACVLLKAEKVVGRRYSTSQTGSRSRGTTRSILKKPSRTTVVDIPCRKKSVLVWRVEAHLRGDMHTACQGLPQSRWWASCVTEKQRYERDKVIVVEER
ncbi:hypothetical protein PV10_00838 [Exophiala mesophila]|uniref:Uncharacterized protein n=1 Tax=Exophiala mesophila TaxID=212818 RepID=A0A0D1X5L0_EXOME|nr:uncharacterized protein PV10_00838 [Exophiala mesophila]KIV97035.1 hypothetical protein PV10_00838 [Exophiala mesophila]